MDRALTGRAVWHRRGRRWIFARATDIVVGDDPFPFRVREAGTEVAGFYVVGDAVRYVEKIAGR